MSLLQYTGSYSGTDQINRARTVSLSKSGSDISNYGISSIKARIYCSTNAYGETYTLNISTQGASGSANCNFTSQNYTGAWFEITLSASSFNPNSVSSMEVTCTSGNGSKIYLKSNTMELNITYTQYGYPTAPTSVSAPSTGNPSGSIIVSWSGASAGTNVSIARYDVYRSTSASGSYSKIGSSTSTSYTDSSLPTNATVYYKIKSIGSVSGYDSGLSSASGGTACYYGAVGAPTSVSAPATGVPGGSITITYSGATNGTNTTVSRYDIYRAEASDGEYTKIGYSTSGSYTDSNLPANKTLYYKVKSIANVSGYDSGLSPASAGTAVYYGACGAPTSVSSPALATPADGVEISWSGATAGTNVSIAGYSVYRSTSADGTYTKIADPASSPYTDTNVSGGNTYYYKVLTRGSTAGYDSGLSTVYSSTKVNAIPTAPTLRGNGKTIYCPRPRVLATAGADSDGDNLTISASGYSSSSNTVASSGKFILRKNANGSGEQSVTVTNTDPNNGENSATITFEIEEATWTDAPIVAGTTIIKAAHINELRDVLDDICDYYGITPTSWETEIIAGVTPDINWPAHVYEIQQTITRIANYVNSWDTESAGNRIVLPAFLPIARPNAAAINQLREIITLL